MKIVKPCTFILFQESILKDLMMLLQREFINQITDYQ